MTVTYSATTATDSRTVVREAFAETIEHLLLGPLYGDSELLPSAPIDTYLTGILWPRNAVIAAGEDEQLDSGTDSDAETTTDDSPVELFSTRRPSSIGVTVQLTEDSGFRVVVSGGLYTPVDMPAAEADGDPVTHWKRQPLWLTRDIPAGFKDELLRTSEFRDATGNTVNHPMLELHLMHRKRYGHLIVTATLINRSEATYDIRNEMALFQSQIAIESTAGAPFEILTRKSEPADDEEDFLTNELLYRDVVEYGVGHGVAAGWDFHDGRIARVYSSWMAYQKVSAVSPDGHKDLERIAKSDTSPFSAKFLSISANEIEIRKRLNGFCDCYSTWIDHKIARVKGSGLNERMANTASRHMAECQRALSRMRKGVDALKGKALQAFCLANEAMDMQSNGEWRGTSARPLMWRPFQLAFLLCAIPSIVNPQDTEERECMDLLWFPTGGGKTEAYLGLVAFSIFHRRLTEARARETGSISVLMRYTLRLLTVQQFQRASALICAADLIRGKNEHELGTERISIGLYVGQAATPQKVIDPNPEFNSAQKAIAEEQRGGKPQSTPRLLLNCPICGAGLSPAAYNVDVATNTMSIRCPEARCATAGSDLPVHTVDEEIYRVRPSLLIGTIDKFAQLPRNEKVGQLLGRPDGLSPDLIIQDELHLISGPLGTMAGLYETALDVICTRNGIRPKIIGSTATIGRARTQVRALFDRSVAQFPPPGLSSSDSFFAVSDPTLPDRVYVGLSTSGRSPKFTLQAAVAAALQAAQYLQDAGKVTLTDLDPFWTVLLYFNSLRELGGAKVMMRDDVARTVPFYAHELKSAPRPLEQEPEEVTSRVSSREIPERLKQLNITLETDPTKGQPLDTVLASNMISVGVDIPRLGLMIVNGQPKSTSEYIQATSRVGRGLPGLILTVYNASRPRDLSHFEHFNYYHQALYRNVEATSVTPWSPRARDRALHAVFASIIRHTEPNMQPSGAATDFHPVSPGTLATIETIVRRCLASGQDIPEAEIREHLQTIINRWNQRTSASDALDYWVTLNPVTGRPTRPHLMRDMEGLWFDTNVWPTPNSMREVEPSAYFSQWENAPTAP